MLSSRRRVAAIFFSTIFVASMVSAVAVAGAMGANITRDGNIAQAGNQDDGTKAISSIAFCAATDVGDVQITSVVEDEDGEAISVSYSATGDLDTIVYKAGQEIYIIQSPSTSGTVTTGEGTLVSDTDEITPASLCPDGESGLKFSEYDSSTNQFEEIEETD